MLVPRARRGLAVAVLLAALPMSACSWQTDQVYTPSVGANARNSEVDVLNALIVSGTPGTGAFVAGLANNSVTEDDQLVSVQAENLTVGPGGNPAIPAGGFINLAESKGLTVTGSKKVLSAGKFVLVRLTFENAEAVNLRVPVVAATGPYADLAPNTTPSPEAP